MFTRTRLLVALALSSVVMLGLVAAPASAQAPEDDSVSILWHEDSTFNRITCDNNILIPDEITAKSWGSNIHAAPKSESARKSQSTATCGGPGRGFSGQARRDHGRRRSSTTTRTSRASISSTPESPATPTANTWEHSSARARCECQWQTDRGFVTETPSRRRSC